MLIVKQSATLEWITPNAEQVIENAARTAYKSESKGDPAAFIKKLMGMKHYSPLEHASASFRFLTERGVSHELVRHRIASFLQESTRYCKYKEGIRVIRPPVPVKYPNLKIIDVKENKNRVDDIWVHAMYEAEKAYLRMLELDVPPQIARSVLPTCTATEIVVTANFREWLHIIKLRTAPNAHPQIQELIKMAQEILIKECPAVFGVEDTSEEE